MQPQYVCCDAITLVGMSFYGDPFANAPGWSQANEIGRLWARFSAALEQGRGQIVGLRQPEAGFEVHIEPPEDRKAGNQRTVFVGVQVERIAPPPLGMFFLVLPPVEYARFALRGAEITGNWGQRIYEQWLPSSDRAEAHPYTIEWYGPRFRGMDDPTSELEVWVPVRPRQG